MNEAKRSELDAPDGSVGFCDTCGKPFPPMGDEIPAIIREELDRVATCADCMTNEREELDAASCSPPPRIWLQWHGDADPDEDGEVSDGDVTWSRDHVFKHDYEYIRADRLGILIDALEGLAMPCTRADYTFAKLDEVVSRLAGSALDDFANAV